MHRKRNIQTSGRLGKVLLAFPCKPPLLEFLEAAFKRRGVSVALAYSDANHWFDNYVIRGVNKLSHNLRIIPKKKNLFDDHPLANKNYRSNNLLKKYHDFKPDLVVLIRGHSYNYSVLEQISENTPMFGWWIEMEGRVEEAFREIHLFDWYFFMNSACIEQGKQRGFADISFLQHAVDPEAFYKLDKARKEIDISFIGNWSHERQEYMEALLRVTDNMAIYGRKWFRKNLLNGRLRTCVRGKYIDGAALVEIYNKTRIVINITNWGVDSSSTRSGLNMRVLETPATGSFLLTDGSLDMDKLLIPGEHVAVYDDLDDCVRQAKYYLQNPEERERIAFAGYQHVRAVHTYDDVAKRIIAQYERLFGENDQPD